MTTSEQALLNPDQEAQLDRLLVLREQLRREQSSSMSPAVERALGLADVYLFLALGYFGYGERLHPEQS